ncbi:ribonuclease H-like domain-containing protein [Tanacetum coccineum]
MKAKIGSIKKNQTRQLRTLSTGYKPIGIKWVFKTKRDVEGNVVKNKACLVAKGYVQRQGVEFEDAFALVAQNANPPPTSNRHVLPGALRAQAVQELHELQRISAFVDSRLESIERFLPNFANQPNETNMNDLESDDESVDTPLVSPFPHSDNDSDDGEVLNESIEYKNV